MRRAVFWEGPGLAVTPVRAELCPAGFALLQTLLPLFARGKPEGRKQPADGCGPDPDLVNN